MDLRKFYLENVTEKDYYYRFYEQVEKVNFTYNIFIGEEETNAYDFDVFDVEEAIEKFRKLCYPENESADKEKDCLFYLILFYFYKSGYYIEEFPRLVERPPLVRFEFVNQEIRSRIIAEGKDDNGTVRYADRRKFIVGLTFKQKTGCIIEIDEEIENKFKEISNRNASFMQMSTDEKLAEIANLIEHYLKTDKGFTSLDYSKICFEFITGEDITNYRKQMHCFRHASSQSINERSSYSETQKSFLVDYGLTIIKVIHALLNENSLT